MTDNAGGIIAQKFQGDVVRFDGKAWQPIDGLHDVAARAFAAGRNGVLIVFVADNTWRLISPQSGTTFTGLEELVENNRDLIVRAFSGSRLTGHECLKFVRRGRPR